jgi:hypothetical protein
MITKRLLLLFFFFNIASEVIELMIETIPVLTHLDSDKRAKGTLIKVVLIDLLA